MRTRLPVYTYTCDAKCKDRFLNHMESKSLKENVFKTYFRSRTPYTSIVILVSLVGHKKENHPSFLQAAWNSRQTPLIVILRRKSYNDLGIIYAHDSAFQSHSLPNRSSFSPPWLSPSRVRRRRDSLSRRCTFVAVRAGRPPPPPGLEGPGTAGFASARSFPLGVVGFPLSSAPTLSTWLPINTVAHPHAKNGRAK